MTPKEKAIDLMQKHSKENTCDCDICKANVKSRALITVEEILEWKDFQEKEMLDYWTEVKQEINKL